MPSDAAKTPITLGVGTAVDMARKRDSKSAAGTPKTSQRGSARSKPKASKPSKGAAPPASIPEDRIASARPASSAGSAGLCEVCAAKPPLVRQACELDSEKVGELAIGTVVHVLETRDMPDGAKRACVALEATPTVAHGWLAMVTKDGTANLRARTAPPYLLWQALSPPYLL